MVLAVDSFIILAFSFFIVATLYASVGFGGGSSYLALLSLFALDFFAIRTIALLCNLFVVSGSCYFFHKKGHFSFREFLPFLITSIPMSFIGAMFKLEERVFFILLGFSLLLSSASLVFQTVNKRKLATKTYPTFLSYVLGGGIGLLSGLVGIGGGIFLAPILNHLNWGKPIKIAALAAFFILANSISGMFGLYVTDTLQLSWPMTLILLISVVLGGQLGVRMSLKKSTPKTIRLGTAGLVLMVGLRILLSKGALL